MTQVQPGQTWHDRLMEYQGVEVLAVSDGLVTYRPAGHPSKTFTLTAAEFVRRHVSDTPNARPSPVPAPPPPPPPFAVGDAVRLAACGKEDPAMTVVGVRADSADPSKQYEIFVAYVPTYGGEGKILRDAFPPAALHRLPGRPASGEGTDGPS